MQVVDYIINAVQGRLAFDATGSAPDVALDSNFTGNEWFALNICEVSLPSYVQLLEKLTAMVTPSSLQVYVGEKTNEPPEKQYATYLIAC